MTKCHTNKQMHVENNPGTKFSRNQKIQRQESHRIGVVGVHWGITHSAYSRPLLIANALTHTPYSWQLLIGSLEPLSINYCRVSVNCRLGDWLQINSKGHLRLASRLCHKC